ncbi:MAG: hypothetical protein NWE89_06065 [Candidatus Bathyarchaeota archaeon]|nr:hypothetical protein [Candidatus Bathyarchaeota archaeon]
MQTFKLYRCSYTNSIETLFDALNGHLSSTTKNVFVGDNEFSLDLRNRYERFELDGERNLWGVIRYEHHRLITDFDGLQRDETIVKRGPFSFAESINNLLLILYGRKEHRSRIINVLNNKLHPRTEFITEVSFSGEMQRRFKELNPHTPTLHIGDTNVPGWRSLRVSGPNITRPATYSLVEQITSEQTSSGMELHNLRWKVILNRGGTVQCFSRVDNHDFIRYMKDRIFPLLG